MKLALLLLGPVAALAAQGSINVTFSQQGAEVLRAVSGKVARGVGVAAVDVCNESDENRVLPAARVYQAAAALKISAISPYLAAPLLDREKSRSLPQIALDVLGIGSTGAGALGTTKVVRMPPGAAAALTLAPIGIAALRELFTKRLPNDSAVRANLLQGDLMIPARNCASRLLLIRYSGAWAPRETAIP